MRLFLRDAPREPACLPFNSVAETRVRAQPKAAELHRLCVFLFGFDPVMDRTGQPTLELDSTVSLVWLVYLFIVSVYPLRSLLDILLFWIALESHKRNPRCSSVYHGSRDVTLAA